MYVALKKGKVEVGGITVGYQTVLSFKPQGTFFSLDPGMLAYF